MNGHSMILINGKRLEGSVKEIYVNLLYQIDLKNSRLEVIKENLVSIWDIIEEHGRIERDLLKGQERACVSRLLTSIGSQRKHWLGINDKNVLVELIYNVILSFEQLGVLPGFGARNSKGDVLYGTPEKNSIDSLKSWSF